METVIAKMENVTLYNAVNGLQTCIALVIKLEIHEFMIPKKPEKPMMTALREDNTPLDDEIG